MSVNENGGNDERPNWSAPSGDDVVAPTPTQKPKLSARFNALPTIAQVAIILAVGAIAAFVWVGYERAADEQSTSEPRSTGAGGDYRIVDRISRSDNDCSFHVACTVFEVTGPCPGGGYIEANLLDADGTVIDWTNDSIPNLRSGETYIGVLGWSDERVERSRVTEFRCRN